jgi:predicted DNA-binding transcriptional regulator AlpA
MANETINNTDALLPPGQMAAELGVKPSWIYRQTMSHGQDSIPRVQVGKYVRFNRRDVFNWIENKQKEREW